MAPLVEDGLVTGAAIARNDSGTTEAVRAKYVIVADGANSRFGRALGTARDRSYPMGMAIRGYFTSPYHDEPWIESHLDLRDRDGNHMPGYGWIFPVGDGTVNVGAGLLDTFTGFTTRQHHQIDGGVRRDRAGAVGHLARDVLRTAHRRQAAHGGSVLPKVGPTWIVAGDAAGSINPFNGEGIAYGYETGRLAAEAVSEALRTGDGLALARYPERLEELYGLYFKVARTFVHADRQPGGDAGAHPGRHALADADGVGAADHGEPAAARRAGPAEAAYAAVEVLVRALPDPRPAGPHAAKPPSRGPQVVPIVR